MRPKLHILLFSFIGLFSGSIVHAQQSEAISIEQAYTLALPEVATNGAVYLEINNASDASIRLLSATTDIAERVELHNAYHDHGTVKMEHVKTVEIAANSKIRLRPGGLHIMLLHLKEPLVSGDDFQLTLSFSDKTKINTNVTIRGAN